MANRQGDVDLRFAQVTAPQLERWLGLARVGSTLATRNKHNTPDHQEGRNDARLPGHDASCTRHYTAQQSTLPRARSTATVPASACKIHRGPPRTRPRIQWYVIAHDGAPLHCSATPHLCPLPAPLGKPKQQTETNLGN